MNDKELIRISKRLARHLRHDPGALGLTLAPGGWVPVDQLVRALSITRAQLDEVVEKNNKRRFAYDETGTRIRASQGHSVPVDLGLPDATPPAVLYHGTVAASLDAIFHEGLRPMNRHAVHLSATAETARTVGARRGKPVILRVDAAAMATDGHTFQVSANGVWLTASVPPPYLSPTP
ncbi:RNA 2'-phosphotransferase [Amycolatopsis vancoresmycina]|uniref:Probable RNA 2'-phosphotransferase n=1 Tax=Amycolatopsis vancoresmycina DSM 44592 TaxID=1292037 RepID=R1HTJ1_9PSEU|nr:RNA 2'-phosphotransferase [Amycolatopsis vancoresmycina]EOD63646.1 RNA 2'-phosphotransferase [Amycolatopsis vancoresmycina DSM 44592]